MTGSEDEVIDYVAKFRHSVSEHEKWRTKTTLNLLAAENFASEGARSFLSTDLSNRYTARDKFYRGTKYAEEVEQLAVELAKKVYGAKFADVRPLSGHTCSLILFMSFLQPGNKVVTCPLKHGGYPGSSEEGLGPLLHLKNLYFPYDPEIMNIIPGETKEFIKRESPELTLFGSSFIPFPYDVSSSLPENYSGITAYDGSHVMGLIAGGEFQSPLSEGCSILMGSTHKTLFGPQGGLILSNDEETFSAIDSKIFPGIVDNIHVNRVASLAFALIELLKFGRQYARQIVRNS
ncbi:MAG TPA: serine hydroxymethyltransferase, partial [Nitrososphaerales archaeon]|nr:serine hydroxymethyltransferase [Nitrososphaerales archaeon]